MLDLQRSFEKPLTSLPYLPQNSFMKILDCESIESTYKSLENILGIKEFCLHKIFDTAKEAEKCKNFEALLSEAHILPVPKKELFLARLKG